MPASTTATAASTPSAEGAQPAVIPALHQVARWETEALHVVDPSALARVDRPALSASTMQGLESCPARFAAEKLLPREDDPYAANVLGTAAHEVFEDLFALPPQERTTDRAILLVSEHAEARWPQESQKADRLKWSAEVMNRVLGLFSIEDPAEVDVLAREEAFNGIEVGGVPFIGFIDRVRRAPGSQTEVEINDYKAGRHVTAAHAQRFGDHHGDQIRLYVAAYEARYGVRPTVGRILYTAAGKSRKVSVTGPAIRRTLAQFADSWDELKSYVAEGAFPAKSSPLCGWCPLVNTCPTAQREGKEAKIPAPSARELPIPGGANLPSGPVRKVDMLADLEAHLDEVGSSGAAGEDKLADAGRVVHVPGADAHRTSEDSEWEQEITAMATRYATKEKPPYNDPPTGKLDPNSYAAMGLFGIVSMAVERLDSAGVKITPTTVAALSKTLAGVLLDAQEEVFGHRDWQAGANSRLRGALRTVLDTLPLPLGRDEAAWDKWATRARRRLVSITQAVLAVYDDEPSYDGDPWEPLAADTVVSRIA